jgi:ethanolamine utilization protein EutQ (cupin superfamily)
MPGPDIGLRGAARRRLAVEIQTGIHVSNVGTGEWEPDPEVGGEMHVLVERDDAFAGMSRFVDVDLVGPWTLPRRETILILEGAARIEIEGGPTLELNVGDMASMPEGAVTMWHLTLPFKEFWFFGQAYDVAD